MGRNIIPAEPHEFGISGQTVVNVGIERRKKPLMGKDFSNGLASKKVNHFLLLGFFFAFADEFQTKQKNPLQKQINLLMVANSLK